MLGKFKPVFLKIKNIFSNPIYIIIFITLFVLIFKSINVTKSVENLYNETVDLSAITVKGYSLENNTLTPLNDDPQMNIPCSSEVINIVSIEFAEPIVSACTARVYYSVDEDMGLSEAKAFNVNIPADSSEVIFELPVEAVYTRIRFDLSSVFTLDNIELHRGSISESLQINYILLIVGVCLIVIILGFYYKHQKKCNEFLKKIIAKYSCDTDFILDNSYKKKLSKLYLFLSITFGIMIIFLSPPNSMPDEPVHFNIASSISKMNFFTQFNENGQLGYYNTSDEVELPVYRKQYDLGVFTYKEAQTLYNQEQNTVTEFYITNGTFNPIGHLIAGVGMAIARASGKDLSAYTLMIIGRFSNLLFSAMLISLSIRKSRALNNTMFLLALMPMTLYQCSSISYDAVVIASTYLLFSTVNNILLSDTNYIVSMGDIISVLLSCFFLFGSKGAVYSTFIITLLAIERKKFGCNKKYIICISLVLLTAIVAYVVPNVILESIVAESGFIEAASVGEQKAYLLSNLGQIPTIVFETFKQYGTNYFGGYVGYLGWQDVRIPYPYFLLFVPVLITSFAIEICYIKKVRWNFRLLSLIAFVISFLGIVFSMYIYYASIRLGVGGKTAYGVQGRYFIPLTLFAMIIFANPALSKFKYSSKIMECESCLVKIAALSSCLITVFTLFMGYWI